MQACEGPQLADRPVNLLSDTSPTDEEKGVRNAKERRRRQNRINQRAHRLRTRHEQGLDSNRLRSRVQTRDQTSIKTPPVLESTAQPGSSILDRLEGPESALGVLAPSDDPLVDQFTCRSNKAALSDFMISRPMKVSTVWVKIPDARKRAILLRSVAQFYASYQRNCPDADHLLSLTRVNVHRAFVSNMVVLGITWEYLESDSISPFSMERPGFDLAVLPEKLRPTKLQSSSVYHPWIDLFPCPVMRDNLIQAGNDWDDEDLCIDIMGYWDGTSTGPFGLLIWGEPADPRSWEITEGFLLKWGWTIQGCVGLMWSTNYWRSKRGVRPLFSKNTIYDQQGLM